MVEWKFNKEDRNITFLIKTMKKKYLVNVKSPRIA
jgi:hypothetical protein